MKYAPVLLLMMCSVMAYAQPVYRCINGSGQIAYQDRACSDQSQPVGQIAQGAPAYMSYEARNDGFGGGNPQPRRQGRLQAKRQAAAEVSKLRLLLKPLNDRREAQYAENRHRCRNALRVAELCGKFAGTFSCDEKGFRPRAIVEFGGPKISPTDNGSMFKMEQCALQASKGRAIALSSGGASVGSR